MAKNLNPLTVFEQEFEHNGVKYELEFRMNTNKYWERKEREKKGRAFVWIPDSEEHDRLVAEIEDELKRIQDECRKAHKKMPKYINTRRGEFPTIDKAWNALNRQIVREEKAVLEAGLEASKEVLDERSLDQEVLDYNPIEAYPKVQTFHRKAGCGCGCSPGFILHNMNGYEIFINEVKEVSS